MKVTLGLRFINDQALYYKLLRILAISGIFITCVHYLQPHHFGAAVHYIIRTTSASERPEGMSAKIAKTIARQKEK